MICTWSWVHIWECSRIKQLNQTTHSRSPAQMHVLPQDSITRMLIRLCLNKAVKANTALKFGVLTNTVQSTSCLPVLPGTTSYLCCILSPSDSDIFPKCKKRSGRISNFAVKTRMKNISPIDVLTKNRIRWLLLLYHEYPKSGILLKLKALKKEK